MSFSRQDTFDLVCRHLLTQRAQSMTGEEGSCAYRGDGGLRCAVGALIPDEFYRGEMEGKPAYCEEVANALRDLGHDVDLCADLQMVHDEYLPNNWARVLRDLASKYDLEFRGVES